MSAWAASVGVTVLLWLSLCLALVTAALGALDRVRAYRGGGGRG